MLNEKWMDTTSLFCCGGGEFFFVVCFISPRTDWRPMLTPLKTEGTFWLLSHWIKKSTTWNLYSWKWLHILSLSHWKQKEHRPLYHCDLRPMHSLAKWLDAFVLLSIRRLKVRNKETNICWYVEFAHLMRILRWRHVWFNKNLNSKITKYQETV